MAGVGMIPPKVLVTPYPWSSVMIRSTLGAPLGGTTVGGQYGLESAAVSLITPPNFGSGGGSCLPSMVVVALGEPGVPVVCCWAWAAGMPAIIIPATNDNPSQISLSVTTPERLPVSCQQLRGP